jgi:hypothetical protein
MTPNLCDHLAMLDIGILPGKGRAVIARAPVAEGAVMVDAPAWRLESGERERIKKSRVFDITFVRHDEYEQGKACGGYIVFGAFSLCNHSKAPNASVEWRIEMTGPWARLVALRDIAVGEEVTLSYVNIDEYNDASEFL